MVGNCFAARGVGDVQFIADLVQVGIGKLFPGAAVGNVGHLSPMAAVLRGRQAQHIAVGAAGQHVVMQQDDTAVAKAQRAEGGALVRQRQRGQVVPVDATVAAARMLHPLLAARIAHPGVHLGRGERNNGWLQRRDAAADARNPAWVAVRVKGQHQRVFDAHLEIGRQQPAAVGQADRCRADQHAGIEQWRHRQHALDREALAQVIGHHLDHARRGPSAKAGGHHEQVEMPFRRGPGHRIADAAHAVAEGGRQRLAARYFPRLGPCIAVPVRSIDFHVRPAFAAAGPPEGSHAAAGQWRHRAGMRHGRVGRGGKQCGATGREADIAVLGRRDQHGRVGRACVEPAPRLGAGGNDQDGDAQHLCMKGCVAASVVAAVARGNGASAQPEFHPVLSYY